ncbi:MAG: GntR family transcriptional regulator [Rhodobacteraceae bacterium]|nr:GntR family transcriptional regulator [Paracoccaceae bacterium]
MPDDRSAPTAPATPPAPPALPAYLRAMAHIRALAESSDFSAGDKIPSERALADGLGLSRMTVRRAVDELVREGVLERRSTAGTIVAPARVVRPLDPAKVIGITEIIRNSGGVPSGRMLSFGLIETPAGLAGHLGILPGETAVAIRMVQFSDGVPFCVERSYLPAVRVPGLAATDVVSGVSLYLTLRNRYGIVPTSTRGVLTAAAAAPDDAAPLGLGLDPTALIYRVTVFDQDGRPIERAISINHPRRTLFSTERRLVVGGEDAMRAVARGP